MSEIKIEKGVAMAIATRNRESLYPFVDMEVGDSFFVAGKKPTSITGSIKNFRKSKNGANAEREFVSRSVEGGVRCWRTK